MKSIKKHVNRYDLSPLAKAGIIVQNMEGSRGNDAHDVFAPHRDLHYMLVFLLDGHIKFKLDFEDTLLESGAITLIRPGQVHQVLTFDQPRGWVIEFDPLLIDKDLQFAVDRALLKSGSLEINNIIFKEITALLGLMESIQIKAQAKKAMFHLLMAVLSLILDNNGQAGEPDKSSSRPYFIHQSFSELLSLHFKEWKQPSQYAGALSISVAHLNDTIKTLTGSSVSDHIQERSVLEAKRLLFFTELSVKETGYEAGYDDPVYFGKLFKKITAISPLQFRSKFRDQDH